MSTVTLRPDATYMTVGWLQYPDDAAAYYLKVDEVSSDEDSTYIYNTAYALHETAHFYVETLTDAARTINSVTVYARIRATDDTITKSIKLSLVTSGITYSSSSSFPTTSYTNYSNTWTTNPSTGLPWTVSDVNNAAFGVSTYIDNSCTAEVRVTQIWIVVDYLTYINYTKTIDPSNVGLTISSIKRGLVTSRQKLVGLGNVTNNKLGITKKFNVTIDQLANIYKLIGKYINTNIGMLSSIIYRTITLNRLLFSSISLFSISNVIGLVLRQFSSSIDIISLNLKTINKKFSNTIKILSYQLASIKTINRKILSNIAMINNINRKIYVNRMFFTYNELFTSIDEQKNIVLQALTTIVEIVSSAITRRAIFNRILISNTFISSFFDGIFFVIRKIVVAIELVNTFNLSITKQFIPLFGVLSIITRNFSIKKLFVSGVSISTNILNRILKIQKIAAISVDLVSVLRRTTNQFRQFIALTNILLIKDTLYEYFKELSVTIGQTVIAFSKGISKKIFNSLEISSYISRFFDLSGKRKISFIRSYKTIDVYREEEEDYS